MNRSLHHLLATVTLLLITSSVCAQQSERFGPYELHYSVVNTTFLEPKVAATYGITRGKKRGILNLSLREHIGDETVAKTMLLKGKTWDLIHHVPLEFMEVREGDAVYSIAEFSFINEEWRFFEIDFRPDGATQSYTFKFKHQLYIN
ncbi:MAG: hypothetical protein ACI9NT_000628 [Bacteroidia bacterium]|jgi:hypothetical protein